MNPSRSSEHSAAQPPRPVPQGPWGKLTRLAAQAAAEPTELPFGFATRAVAAWRANRRESSLAAFEWLTLRGLAVALLIFAGSAAFGYEAVSEAFAGEASLVGGWVDYVTFPQ